VTVSGAGKAKARSTTLGAGTRQALVLRVNDKRVTDAGERFTGPPVPGIRMNHAILSKVSTASRLGLRN